MKLHEDIFRQRKDQEPIHHFWKHFWKRRKTHSSPWQESTHIQRDRDTQHVLIYCRSRLSISNGKITVQNESSWHQTCIFSQWAVKKRTFTHFKSVLLQFFSRPLLLHDVRHSTTLELPRKTTFKRKAAPNLYFRHNKTSEKSEFVYIKVLVQVRSRGPDNSAAGSDFPHVPVQVMFHFFSLLWTPTTCHLLNANGKY